MAANRGADVLLALVSTGILFVIFVLVTRIPALTNYSYQPDYGWQTSDTPHAYGQCDRSLTGKGFPLKTQRPVKDDPSGCLDETNPLASDMNIALCFALAAVVAVGEVGVIRNMRS